MLMLGGIGIHRLATAKDRREKARESLSLCVRMCKKWSEESGQAELSELEALLRQVKKEWGRLGKELKERYNWNEPIIGDGFFCSPPSPPDIHRLASYLLSLPPFASLAKAIRHTKEGESSDVSELERQLRELKKYWRELESELEEKFEWEEPVIGYGHFKSDSPPSPDIMKSLHGHLLTLYFGAFPPA